MQAIILAGGFGTRLRPLTEQLPKPMVSVANEPLLSHTLELLKQQGIRNVGITLGYLPQYIKDFFSDGKNMGMNVTYFEEDFPLGTAGSVKQAEKYLDETFAVISGDALTDIPISKIIAYHKEKGADVTIVAKKEVCPLEYGVVEIAQDGGILGFSEKPQWENVTSDTVNTGIYILEKSVLANIPENSTFDFGKDLFPRLLTETAKMYGYITENYWSDLGTPDTYLQANFDFLDRKNYSSVTGENLYVSEETEIIPPVLIGKNAVFKGKNIIGPYAVIGDGTLIENGIIKRSVIADRAIIKNTELNFSAVDSHAECDGCVFAGNNIVGANAVIEKNAHILINAKVPCNAFVERNSVFNENGIISFAKRKNLFVNGKITGVWGKDITPEVLEGLASSLKGDKVCIGYGEGLLSANCANLLASYFALSGKTVYLFYSGESSFRYFACCNGIKGVYVSSEYPDVEFDVVDEKGLNISSDEEKKINFSLKAEGESKKIVRLENREKRFEYFLNSSFPFMRSNTSVFSREKLKLHNIVFAENSQIPQKGIYIFAPKGRILDMYRDGERVSTTEFLYIKCDLSELLGAKEVFLPIYAPDECVSYAKDRGLKVLKEFAHKGNTMQQTQQFVSPSCLLEFDPAFFALCYCFYRERINSHARGAYIAEYTFECDRNKTSSLINVLNKKNDGFVTVIPKNDGYSFSVYRKFASEEYAPDMTENFGVFDGI